MGAGATGNVLPGPSCSIVPSLVTVPSVEDRRPRLGENTPVAPSPVVYDSSISSRGLLGSQTARMHLSQFRRLQAHSRDYSRDGFF